MPDEILQLREGMRPCEQHSLTASFRPFLETLTAGVSPLPCCYSRDLGHRPRRPAPVCPQDQETLRAGDARPTSSHGRGPLQVRCFQNSHTSQSPSSPMPALARGAVLAEGALLREGRCRPREVRSTGWSRPAAFHPSPVGSVMRRHVLAMIRCKIKHTFT